MSIRFDCPRCGKRLKAPDSDGGRQTLCTGCGQLIPIPRGEGDPAGEEEDDHAPLADEESLDPFHLMHKSGAHQEDLIDMTAMVDIVFFMLIFFMVASAQAIVAVMDMPPVQSQTASARPKTAVDIENDPDIIVIRIEDDDSIWVEDEQVFGEQNLRVKMRNLVLESDLRSVVVFGSADASHGAAVQVFDACMSAGIEDIRLSVKEDTAE